MRSAREIGFRLRQEVMNAWLLARPPVVNVIPQTPLDPLPDPAGVVAVLSGTPYAAGLERLADQILAHRVPILGIEIQTGPQIAWRCDYVSGIETQTSYFRRIPYLDHARVGDHKVIWELSRHQHLVVLAQTWRLTGRQVYLDELLAQLESWWRQNPFQRGVNWTSALEVAFRALSWLWVYHLAGESMPEAFRRRFLNELYRHGRHLEFNLSVYFSPNTHLLIEAVALHALGRLCAAFPGSQRWRRAGAEIVSVQMERQVREDGSHFEQSTYYLVYTLDAFLFHAVLEPVNDSYRRKLARMAEYLAALLGRARRLPFLGDDDGGRFFHPFGPRDCFGRATLATCAALLGATNLGAVACDGWEQAAWWLGPKAVTAGPPQPGREMGSRLFHDAGVAVMETEQFHVVVDAGPFGTGSAGHSHSDTLSAVVRSGEEDILIDPGTYTYVTDLARRNWFRGSAAHNTLRVDRRDQASPAGPFRWSEPPRVRMVRWSSEQNHSFLEATCEYAGLRHRRRFLLLKPALLVIFDEVDGPAGEHEAEQFWHLGSPVTELGANRYQIADTVLMLPQAEKSEYGRGGEHGWRSRALGSVEESPVIRVVKRSPFPLVFAAALVCSEGPRRLDIDQTPEWSVRLDTRHPAVRFPREGGWDFLAG